MSLIIKNRIQEFDVKEYYKKIYKGSKAEFMKKLEGEIEAGKKQCVVTANPEIFMPFARFPATFIKPLSMTPLAFAPATLAIPPSCIPDA